MSSSDIPAIVELAIKVPALLGLLAYLGFRIVRKP